MKAQDRLTRSAPAPVKERANGSGVVGMWIFSQAVQRVASPGTKRIPASAIPTRARRAADQPIAARIRRLTEASSRKSTLAANSETEPIERATANSIPKYPRVSRATRQTTRRRPESVRGPFIHHELCGILGDAA